MPQASAGGGGTQVVKEQAVPRAGHRGGVEEIISSSAPRGGVFQRQQRTSVREPDAAVEFLEMFASPIAAGLTTTLGDMDRIA